MLYIKSERLFEVANFKSSELSNRKNISGLKN